MKFGKIPYILRSCVVSWSDSFLKKFGFVKWFELRWHFEILNKIMSEQLSINFEVLHKIM